MLSIYIHIDGEVNLITEWLPVVEVTVKTNSMWRRLATLISGAERTMNSTASAEKQRAAPGIVKVDREFAFFCHFAEDDYAQVAL